MTPQSWTSSSSNMLKFNVNDHTWQDNAYTVAVCRDLHDRVSLQPHCEIGHTGHEHAKAKAILLRMKLAVELRDRSCIVVSDAKNLVHWICNKDLIPSWRVAHVIYECRILLQDNTSTRLEFGSRSPNEAFLRR